MTLARCSLQASTFRHQLGTAPQERQPYPGQRHESHPHPHPHPPHLIPLPPPALKADNTSRASTPLHSTICSLFSITTHNSIQYKETSHTANQLCRRIPPCFSRASENPTSSCTYSLGLAPVVLSKPRPRRLTRPPQPSGSTSTPPPDSYISHHSALN